jgi:hypothetical protein
MIQLDLTGLQKSASKWNSPQQKPIVEESESALEEDCKAEAQEKPKKAWVYLSLSSLMWKSEEPKIEKITEKSTIEAVATDIPAIQEPVIQTDSDVESAIESEEWTVLELIPETSISESINIEGQANDPVNIEESLVVLDEQSDIESESEIIEVKAKADIEETEPENKEYFPSFNVIQEFDWDELGLIKKSTSKNGDSIVKVEWIWRVEEVKTEEKIEKVIEAEVVVEVAPIIEEWEKLKEEPAVIATETIDIPKPPVENIKKDLSEDRKPAWIKTFKKKILIYSLSFMFLAWIAAFWMSWWKNETASIINTKQVGKYTEWKEYKIVKNGKKNVRSTKRLNTQTW